MARRKSSDDEAKKGAPEWMTTYGDMVTLLLCFFVLLFAFSEVDAKKFDAFIQSFQGSLGVLDSGLTIEQSDYISEAMLHDLTTKQQEELEDFRKLKERLDEFLQDRNLDADILISLETRGLVVRFQDNVLFDPGDARLKSESEKILLEIAEFMQLPEYEEKNIRVEGHTDTVPTGNNSKYETNWELSTTRATNVVRYLSEKVGLRPERFTASGFSEYHPVAPNDTRENKAKNRRVDIVILRTEFIAPSPDLN
ncbi:OmpA/MotB family protein [Serpentinicella alkaliphila]|uniref:Chemotaxis protein MotB n=1 Tax=Serpentinicella alkaliphila TaxID=1734049 RepID=A0A4R2TSH9_9FIRM|nr:flagellar motor protein MotB [Serpentinicella alkaliphila]QUH26286.1 flagellar motor protein MotB [Serpentinicella alkaliphila]TCQ05866.1 chemotaxis protein MotB [Serpentinicella alkaliphila]